METSYIRWKVKLAEKMSPNDIVNLIGFPQQVDDHLYIKVWHYDYPGGGVLYFDKNYKLDGWVVPNDKKSYYKIEKIEKSALTKEVLKNAVNYGMSHIEANYLLERYGEGKELIIDRSEGYKNNQKEKFKRESEVTADELKYGKTLGLKGAVTIKDIKKAFQIKIKEYHPDKISSMGIELQELAEKKTREIIEAYDYFCSQYS